MNRCVQKQYFNIKVEIGSGATIDLGEFLQTAMKVPVCVTVS